MPKEMRFIWEGKWKRGKLSIESDSIRELEEVLEGLETEEPTGDTIILNGKEAVLDMPKVSGELKCADAIKAILGSDWGNREPRTMPEIKEAMETNGIYFPKGTISGMLTYLTKKGYLRRIKKNNIWAYTLIKR